MALSRPTHQRVTQAVERALRQTETSMFAKEKDVGAIFRRYMSQYRKEYSLSYEQQRQPGAIMECRTPALGGVIKACTECGSWEFQYKSCKNRHCPKCGAFEKAQWLEAQKIWVLPIHYYHVVFTLDHVFNPLVWWNQEVMYNQIIEDCCTVVERVWSQGVGR